MFRTMTAEKFGILRTALRCARQAGYVYTRDLARSRQWAAPANGRFRSPAGPYPHAPYLFERANETVRESFEITDAERAAFGLEPDAKYCTFTETSPLVFELTEYEIDYSMCDRCEDTVLSDDTCPVYVAGRRSHQHNEAVWCDDCADQYATAYNDSQYDNDICVYVHGPDETMPESVAQDNYFQHSDGGWYSDPEDDDSDDENQSADDTGAIYKYGTNVLDTHDWPAEVKTDALCFGVELEVEPADEDASSQHALAEALGGKRGFGDEGYILAADSSLEHGIEIITVPQTLEQHRTGSRIQWHAISKALQAAKARSGAGTENCGMHIHINRKALSALTVGKMLVFVNANCTRALLELVAQRSATRYCERKAKKVTDALRPSDEHYDALNIGTEHGTLELRIFRGNTRYTRIMKNLEFAHALCIYCRDASLQDVTEPALFRAWIAARAAMYPHLSKYLTEHTEDA